MPSKKKAGGGCFASFLAKNKSVIGKDIETKPTIERQREQSVKVVKTKGGVRNAREHAAPPPRAKTRFDSVMAGEAPEPKPNAAAAAAAEEPQHEGHSKQHAAHDRQRAAEQAQHGAHKAAPKAKTRFDAVMAGEVPEPEPKPQAEPQLEAKPAVAAKPTAAKVKPRAKTRFDAVMAGEKPEPKPKAEAAADAAELRARRQAAVAAHDRKQAAEQALKAAPKAKTRFDAVMAGEKPTPKAEPEPEPEPEPDAEPEPEPEPEPQPQPQPQPEPEPEQAAAVPADAGHEQRPAARAAEQAQREMESIHSHKAATSIQAVHRGRSSRRRNCAKPATPAPAAAAAAAPAAPTHAELRELGLAPDISEDEAATRIQAIHRGRSERRLARQQSRRAREQAVAAAPPPLSPAPAATEVAAVEADAEAATAAEEKAATSIQAIHRGRASRRRARAKPAAPEPEPEPEPAVSREELAAARAIQARARGRATRKAHKLEWDGGARLVHPLPRGSNLQAMADWSDTELVHGQGADAWVTASCIAAGGRAAVTGTRDGTVRMWSLPGGRLLAESKRHASAITRTLVRPPVGMDGERGDFVITVAQDGEVVVWEILPEDAVPLNQREIAVLKIQAAHRGRQGRRKVAGLRLEAAAAAAAGREFEVEFGDGPIGAKFRLKDDGFIRVTEVKSHSQAETAGLEPDDIITAVHELAPEPGFTHKDLLHYIKSLERPFRMVLRREPDESELPPQGAPSPIKGSRMMASGSRTTEQGTDPARALGTLPGGEEQEAALAKAMSTAENSAAKAEAEADGGKPELNYEGGMKEVATWSLGSKQDDVVRASAWSTGGGWVLFGHADGTITTVRVSRQIPVLLDGTAEKPGKRARALAEGEVTAMCWASIGDPQDGVGRALVGSSAGVLRMVDLATMKDLADFSGHSDRICECVWISEHGLHRKQASTLLAEFEKQKSTRPDGETSAPGDLRILTCAWDGTVKTWSLPEGDKSAAELQSFTLPEQERQLLPNSDEIHWQGMALSPSHERIATAVGNLVVVWHLSTGSVTAVKQHIDRVLEVDFWRIFPEGWQEFVDDESGKPYFFNELLNLTTWKPPPGIGDWVLSSSRDCRAKAWARCASNAVHKLAGGNKGSEIRACCAAQRQPGLVATAAEGGAVELWDVVAGGRRRRFQATDDLWSCSLSPDARAVAVGCEDGTLQLFDCHEKKAAGSCRGHTDVVLCCQFSFDGSLLASGSFDKTVRLWDAADLSERGVLSGHSGWVQAVAFQRQQDLLASASEDGTVRVWNVASGESTLTLQGAGGAINCVTWSPADAAHLACGGASGTLSMWDVETELDFLTLKGHTSAVSACDLSNDGQLLLSSSWDKTVRVWDTRAGVQVATHVGHDDWVMGCAFLAGGGAVAGGGVAVSCSRDGVVAAWPDVVDSLS